MSFQIALARTIRKLLTSLSFTLIACGLHPLDDADGDGFSSGVDCDDTNPNISPGAAETCDGRDEDCSGTADDGDIATSIRYLDYDGDGFGTERYTLASCSIPEGWAAAPGDCDDTDPSSAPGGSEQCDGADNDCNAVADDLPDLDQDGHPPCAADGTGIPDDCDDSDPHTYPGAPDLCDGADNDCNGLVDDAPDLDADGFPSCSSNLEQVDCDDDSPHTYPGAAERCDGVDNGCNGVSDEGFDQDGDGHSTCDRVSSPVDCDDRDAAVYPGATERCDGRDQDCDGITDEGFPDEDGDGAPRCEDCDDTDPRISNLHYDTCDALDNDCDGHVDNGGDCPCEVNRFGDHSYLFCLNPMDWGTASGECQRYGYHLVVIGSEEENTWLSYTAGNYMVIDWWLGLTDSANEGSWRWVDGSSPTYTGWAKGEPNDLNNEDCAQLYPDGTWNDKACSSPWYRFICESG